MTITPSHRPLSHRPLSHDQQQALLRRARRCRSTARRLMTQVKGGQQANLQRSTSA